MGQGGGLGEEDVLHRQEIEVLQGPPRMPLVRVREDRVLPQDEHPLEVALGGGIHGPGEGEPRLFREPVHPQARANFSLTAGSATFW